MVGVTSSGVSLMISAHTRASFSEEVASSVVGATGGACCWRSPLAVVGWTLHVERPVWSRSGSWAG